MSDLEWGFIKGVLPNKSRGVKRVDDRRIINVIGKGGSNYIQFTANGYIYRRPYR